MNNLQRQYWNEFNKATLKKYPGIKWNDGFDNPLRPFLNSSHRNVLEIGAGQSNFIIDLLDGVRKFIVYDEDRENNNLLVERINQINPAFVETLEVMFGRFPQIKINYANFDVFVFSNVFHFISPDELQNVVIEIGKQIKMHSLVYFRSHSIKQSKPNETFKTMLSSNDIYDLFPKTSWKYQVIREMNIVETQAETECSVDALRAIALNNNWDQDNFVQKNRKNFSCSIDWEVIVERI